MAMELFLNAAFLYTAIAVAITLLTLFTIRLRLLKLSFFFFSFSLLLYVVFFMLSFLNIDVQNALLYSYLSDLFSVTMGVSLLYHSIYFARPDIKLKIWHFLPLILVVLQAYFMFQGDVLIYIVPTILCSHAALAFSYYAYKKDSSEKSLKRRLKWVCMSQLIGLVGIWTPVLFATLPAMKPHGFLFIFLLHFGLSYALLDFNAFNFKGIFSKTPAFIAAVLIVSFVSTYVFYTYFLMGGLIGDGYSFIVVASLLSLVIGALFAPLTNFLYSVGEKAFVKGWYNLDQAVSTLASELVPVNSIKEAYIVLKKTLENIEMKGVSVLYPDLRHDKIERFYLDEIDNTDSLRANHPFIQFFNSNKATVTVDAFSDDVKASIEGHPYFYQHMYVPFYSGKDLAGVVIVGSKVSGDKFGAKDRLLFQTLQSQMAVVLDRIRPYEKIKQEFESKEKRLHDEEVQSLLNIQSDSLLHTIQEYNHEINTPLQAILTHAESLPDSDDKDVILKAHARATDIVRTTLDLIGNGESDETDELLDINSFTKQIVKEFQFNKNIKVNDSISDENWAIKAKQNSIKLIFNNLLINAQEAMEVGGDLRIRTYCDDDTVSIEFKDSGVGIEKERLKEIWQPFRSGHTTKGRGLGLQIVMKHVTLNKGQVSVESEVGEGAVFTVSFPLLASF